MKGVEWGGAWCPLLALCVCCVHSLPHTWGALPHSVPLPGCLPLTSKPVHPSKSDLLFFFLYHVVLLCAGLLQDMGLAFDEWDLDYYTKLFK